MSREEITDLARRLKNHLEENDGEIVYWGEEIKVRGAQYAVRGQTPSDTQPAVSPSASSTTHSVPRTTHLNANVLEDLRLNTIGDCRLCPLSETRIKIVFGVGNPQARVMFVGEGPGFDEDRKGEPFVGKAGQLLDKIMAAIGLDRTSVYIANVVKCHPMVDPSTPDKRGNDRPPSPAEIEKCRPFLLEQIRVIKPEFIVTLGGTATKALLGTSRGITSVRGQWFDLNEGSDFPAVKVLPTFHPAALLRDDSLKKMVWEDMKQLRSKIST